MNQPIMVVMKYRPGTKGLLLLRPAWLLKDQPRPAAIGQKEGREGRQTVHSIVHCLKLVFLSAPHPSPATMLLDTHITYIQH